MTDNCKVLATWNGYCADCERDRPLVLVERGCFGIAAWLRGIGSEDRTLRYACRVCGRVEFVPPTEEEDRRYDATLARWPDIDLMAELAALQQATVAAAITDSLAGTQLHVQAEVGEDPHLAASAELSALALSDVPRSAHLHINPDTPVTGPPVEAVLPAAALHDELVAELAEAREPQLPSLVPAPRTAPVLVVSTAPRVAPVQPTDLVLFALAA